MLMSLLQPQQMLAIGFGEATMNTLQRLSGFISSQQIRLGHALRWRRFLYDGYRAA